MEIEYTLTPKDFQALARYRRKLKSVPTHPPLKTVTIIRVSISVIVIIGGAMLPMFLFKTDILSYWMGLYIGWFAGMLLLLWYAAYINRSNLKADCEDPRSEWAVRDVRVVLSSNQVRSVKRGATFVYEWSRIWHIGETDNHLFLFITRNTAIIIPHRAFRDNRHCEEFIALARHYKQDRGQQAPKPTGIITVLPPQSDAFTRADEP